MEEGLAAEHGGELLGDALEQLLDGGAVPDERGGHLETARGDVADRCLHVVRDPLDEVRAILVLHVQHLLVHLHSATAETRSDDVLMIRHVESTIYIYMYIRLYRISSVAPQRQ